MGDSVEQRLERVEASLERLIGLMESSAGGGHGQVTSVGPVGPSGSIVVGATRGAAALDAALGAETVQEQVAELVMRLGDPETLGAITRITQLAPSLEYALTSVAAGPALLEEGLELARDRMGEHGVDADLQLRLQAGADALLALSEPAVTRTLSRLASRTPSLAPLLEGAADGVQRLRVIEGDAALRERLAEVVCRVAEPDTLDAIGRLVTLLPDLEYAVNGLAAGPALLEEGFELAKTRLAEAGVSTHDLTRRTEAAAAAVEKLSRPGTLDALGRVASALPSVQPAVDGLARGVAELASVEGPATLEARLAESLVRIAEPETLDALTRIATLAPSLEYAVNALAAGPALLEEALEVAKIRLEAVDAGPSVQPRLDAAGRALLRLTRPQALDALGVLADALPPLVPLARATTEAFSRLAEVEGAEALSERLTETLVTLAEPDTLAALTRLASLAPQLEYAAYFVAAGPALLEEGLELVRNTLGQELQRVLKTVDLEAVATIATSVDWAALAKLTQQVDLSALAKLVEAVDLEALTKVLHAVDANKLANLLGSEPALELLEGLVHLVEDDPSRQAILQVIAMAPRLRRSLAALPTEGATLGLLASVNRAVAEAAQEKRSAGVFGSLSALRDPKVQRVMGFLFDVAERLGTKLDDPKALVEAGMVRSKPKGSN